MLSFYPLPSASTTQPRKACSARGHLLSQAGGLGQVEKAEWWPVPALRGAPRPRAWNTHTSQNACQVPRTLSLDLCPLSLNYLELLRPQKQEGSVNCRVLFMYEKSYLQP